MVNNKKRKNNPYLLLAIFLVAAIFAYGWEKIQLVRNGYRLQKLEKELTFWENENRYFQIKFVQLTALEKIDKLARGKLGMVLPKQEDVILLPSPEIKAK
ncbi:MAG: hypothetical protein ABII74_02720 [Elusimicrobiota bacterium]